VYDDYTAGYITPLGGMPRANCTGKAASIFTHAVRGIRPALAPVWMGLQTDRALYPAASSRLFAAVSGSGGSRGASAWPMAEGGRRDTSGFPFVGGMGHPGEGSPKFDTVPAKLFLPRLGEALEMLTNPESACEK
jgi:hypothetical protein